ncbi:MAG: hypothetical protein ACPHGV_08735 [Synechococcus sp.]
MSTCTICGGSGTQRVSNQRFRTCLTCLGHGQIPSAVIPASARPWATFTPGLARSVELTKPAH